MKIGIYRRQRAAWFRYEWHRNPAGSFAMVSVANPRRHSWWATAIYLFF